MSLLVCSFLPTSCPHRTNRRTNISVVSSLIVRIALVLASPQICEQFVLRDCGLLLWIDLRFLCHCARICLSACLDNYVYGVANITGKLVRFWGLGVWVFGW
ncbi:hypothetical protein BKA80DRAFT_259119 [Phyllosticta citrichinensis]